MNLFHRCFGLGLCILSSVIAKQEDIRDNPLTCKRVVECSWLSALVYQIIDNVTTLEPKQFRVSPSFAEYQYENNTWIDDGSTEVLINRKANTIGGIPKNCRVVTFRGSEESLDWAINFDQFQVPYGPPDFPLIDYKVVIPGGSSQQWSSVKEIDVMIHRGFSTSLKLYSQILSLLEELDNEECKDLYVQGHSLGGANAQTFSTYYAFHHPNTKVHLTSYGSPRMGNLGYKYFSEGIQNLNQYRVVNTVDIIPTIPYDDFHHAGHLCWRYNDTNPSSGEYINTLVTKIYYRQIGNSQFGYKGVKDFSISRLQGLDTENRADVITPHFMTTIKQWLENDCASNNFPMGFETV